MMDTTKLFYKYHGFVESEPTTFQRTIDQFKLDLPVIERIIFDDGLSSQKKIIPLLLEEKKRGLKGVFAIPTAHIGEEGRLTWYDLNKIKHDFEIANHSHTHTDLTTLTYDEVKTEIQTANAIILDKLGIICKYFTAPYDKYNDNVIKVCDELGLSIIQNRVLVKNDTVLATGKNYWEDIFSGNSSGQKGGNEHIRFAEVEKHLNGNRIIDVGAGYAGLAKQLKEKFPEKEIVCLDFSEKAAKASGYHPYVVSSCEKMPFPDKHFDMLTCLQAMEYFPDDDAFLTEAKRIAKKGIFTATNGKHPTCYQLKTYTPESFRELISKYGKIEHTYVIHNLIFVKAKL